MDPQSGEHQRTVQFRATDGADLEGDLTIPEPATGLVVFAHGSGSSRHSPRNRLVAARLNERGLATFLIDLLTGPEEIVDSRRGHLRFDVDLLAGRLADATAWAAGQAEIRSLPIGYFGASTGAGAALVAAARQPGDIAAVVSRGGRPDLAGPLLASVQAPTLLIVGGDDDLVIRLNRGALGQLRVRSRIEIIPGASHLFEEPGALEQVALLAGDWFSRYLRADHLTGTGT